jgi:hypothetical protein
MKAENRGLGCEVLPQGLSVLRGRDLTGQEQGYHASGSDQLEGALDEGDREIRKVSEPARATAAPQAESALQHRALAGRESLGAYPRGIAYDDVEPPSTQDVGGLDLE